MMKLLLCSILMALCVAAVQSQDCSCYGSVTHPGSNNWHYIANQAHIVDKCAGCKASGCDCNIQGHCHAEPICVPTEKSVLLKCSTSSGKDVDGASIDGSSCETDDATITIPYVSGNVWNRGTALTNKPWKINELPDHSQLHPIEFKPDGSIVQNTYIGWGVKYTEWGSLTNVINKPWIFEIALTLDGSTQGIQFGLGVRPQRTSIGIPPARDHNPVSSKYRGYIQDAPATTQHGGSGFNEFPGRITPDIDQAHSTAFLTALYDGDTMYLQVVHQTDGVVILRGLDSNRNQLFEDVSPVSITWNNPTDPYSWKNAWAPVYFYINGNMGSRITWSAARLVTGGTSITAPVIVNDVNCAGMWSECTDACELGVDRSFSITTAQSGAGDPCPTNTTDCQPSNGLCASCDLRLDSDDIEKTWMNAYTISKGEVTVNIREELEWTIIADAKLTLSGNTATCNFTWSYKEELCDYREWTGMIGIYDLLQCSTPVTKDLAVAVDAAKISQVRVEFQMVSSRNVKYYIAGIETGSATTYTTTRTTLLPMLFNFQRTIVVQSADITVTAMYFPVTDYVVTLTDRVGGALLTDVNKDEISKTIATFFNFPTAALKFTFNETIGIVVTAQVPGDVSGSCSLLTFTPNFDVSGAAVCTVGQDFASIREVTERSVVSVKVTDELVAEARVKAYTNVQVPFELKNPEHVGTKPFTFSAFGITGTCGVDTACVKYFEWTMRDNKSSDPVCDFSGNYEVQFDVVCSKASIDDDVNFKCPLDGNEKISASLSLESGDHCPDADKAVAIALLATDLVSNRVDSEAEVPIDSFLNTQKLKFHSNVRSEDAALKDASFIAISIKAVNGGANAVDLTLLNDQVVTDDGRLLTLELFPVVNSNTDPAVVDSVLSPSFTLIADAGALGLAVQETAVFTVTATIAAVYKAGRRRALLQVSYDASTETSRTVIISAEEPALEVFEESAAHGSVPAGILLALLSVYIVLALHF